MDTIKFGLLLTVIPFIVIMQFITVWWAFADIGLRKFKGAQRALWMLLIVMAPPLGPLVYHYLTRQHDGHPAPGQAHLKAH